MPNIEYSVWETYFQFPINRHIGLVGRVFANGPGDLGSIPGHNIPKSLKIVLDTSLLKAQHYKVRIKGKVEQSTKGRQLYLHNNPSGDVLRQPKFSTNLKFKIGSKC